MKSSTWKWIGIAVLAIVGILALIVGIEWLTVPIHKLPSFLGQKHGRGHYKRRGEAAVVFGVVALAVTAYLAYRMRRASAPGPESKEDGAATPSVPGDSTSLLSAPAATAGSEPSSAPVTAPDNQPPVGDAEQV